MMLKQNKLTDQEAHKLFAKFAAPVFRAAKTPSQQKGAEGLTRFLWLALLTGHDIETTMFEDMKKLLNIQTEDLAVIKDRYYSEMKPSITSEELSLLRVYFKVRKK